MIANSMTIYHHPEELFYFMKELESEGAELIISAVFQPGFLVGGDYFDYQKVNSNTLFSRKKYRWRKKFFTLFDTHVINYAHACIQFARHLPGVNSLALNSTSTHRMYTNASY